MDDLRVFRSVIAGCVKSSGRLKNCAVAQRFTLSSFHRKFRCAADRTQFSRRQHRIFFYILLGKRRQNDVPRIDAVLIPNRIDRSVIRKGNIGVRCILPCVQQTLILPGLPLILGNERRHIIAARSRIVIDEQQIARRHPAQEEARRGVVDIGIHRVCPRMAFIIRVTFQQLSVGISYHHPQRTVLQLDGHRFVKVECLRGERSAAYLPCLPFIFRGVADGIRVVNKVVRERQPGTVAQHRDIVAQQSSEQAPWLAVYELRSVGIFHRNAPNARIPVKAASGFRLTVEYPKGAVRIAPKLCIVDFDLIVRMIDDPQVVPGLSSVVAVYDHIVILRARLSVAAGNPSCKQPSSFRNFQRGNALPVARQNFISGKIRQKFCGLRHGRMHIVLAFFCRRAEKNIIFPKRDLLSGLAFLHIIIGKLGQSAAARRDGCNCRSLFINLRPAVPFDFVNERFIAAVRGNHNNEALFFDGNAAAVYAVQYIRKPDEVRGHCRPFEPVKAIGKSVGTRLGLCQLPVSFRNKRCEILQKRFPFLVQFARFESFRKIGNGRRPKRKAIVFIDDQKIHRARPRTGMFFVRIPIAHTAARTVSH